MTATPNNETLFIEAIKHAHALRQLLFDRPGGYTRDEMLAANSAIQKATEEWLLCCRAH